MIEINDVIEHTFEYYPDKNKKVRIGIAINKVIDIMLPYYLIDHDIKIHKNDVLNHYVNYSKIQDIITPSSFNKDWND